MPASLLPTLLLPALLRLHLAYTSTNSNAEYSCQHRRCKGASVKCADRHLWSAGSAGKLQLQLIDTASNTGAVEPLATATVDLDMRRWKDSQTYQAEVPLVADGVIHTCVYTPNSMVTFLLCTCSERSTTTYIIWQTMHPSAAHTSLLGCLQQRYHRYCWCLNTQHSRPMYLNAMIYTHTLCC